MTIEWADVIVAITDGMEADAAAQADADAAILEACGLPADLLDDDTETK